MATFAIDTLPLDCRYRIIELTEQREHSDEMIFTEADAAELDSWETYLAELDSSK